MYIVKAAIMYSNGEIIEGRTYGHIDSIAQKLGFEGSRIEGFVTETDEFVLPIEAAKIASEAGQITEINGSLSPENLWPQGMVLE